MRELRDQHASAVERGPRGGVLDSVAVALTCFAVYVALGQRTPSGVDFWADLRWLSAGHIQSPIHLLYLPMAHAAAQVGESLGLSLHDAVRLLSAVGGAVGVAFCHAAARVTGLGRAESFAVALLVGAAPGVLFYSTVVERHAPFFAFAGLAFWCGAHWLSRPTWWRGALLGLAVGLAYAAHSTGALLPAILAPMLVFCRREPALGRRVGAVVALAAASAVALWLVGRVGRWTGWISLEGGNFAFLLQHAERSMGMLGALPLHVAQELLLPLAPVCLLWLAVLRSAGGRNHAAALAVGLLVYLGLSFAILGDYDERGAYLLPLVWPMALATLRGVGLRLALGAGVVALALSVGQVLLHDDRWPRAVAERLESHADGRPLWLLPGARPDFELLFLEYEAFVHIEDYADLFRGAHNEDLAGGLAVVPVLIQLANNAGGSGRCVLMSDAAIDFLERAPGVEHPEIAARLLQALRAAFRFEACPQVSGWNELVPIS